MTKDHQPCCAVLRLCDKPFCCFAAVSIGRYGLCYAVRLGFTMDALVTTDQYMNSRKHNVPPLITHPPLHRPIAL
ncbi:uncharacterized protein UV8b_03000 [Ustilaginoidea virens]|uniref:Uncharacterized protein n=1 Tax=Ustilaginoidea virens TaxID=1159556 RepID=A0A8E5HNT4_USTVR|nr:uncharacterized protein UV8b_03000 [Ustilaginoidea virens]QUC18759.1 hypothetical protein UV8b_03000 [Ustilaginoidea virens]